MTSTLQTIVDEWLTYLEGPRGFSSCTIRAYRADLGRYLDTLPSGAGSEALTVQTVRRWQRERWDSGSATAATMARELTAIRQFCRWGYRFQTLPPEAERVRALRPPRVPSKLPGEGKAPSVDTMARWLALPDMGTVAGLRLRALLEVGYGSGLRISEIAAMDLENVGEEGVFVRQGKGARDRWAPLGGPGRMALRAWLRRGRPLWETYASGAAVFIGRRSGKRLVVRQLYRIMHGSATAAGIPSFHPHLLRHACGTHLLDSGADLRTIQEILGHRRITTTARYCGCSLEQLGRTVAECHPRGAGAHW